MFLFVMHIAHFLAPARQIALSANMQSHERQRKNKFSVSMEFTQKWLLENRKFKDVVCDKTE